MKNIFVVVIIISCLGGCSSMRSQSAGQLLMPVENEDELILLANRVKEMPDNIKLKSHFVRQRELYLNTLLLEANSYREKKDFVAAIKLYERMLTVAPSLAVALMGKSLSEVGRQHEILLTEVKEMIENKDYNRADKHLRTVLIEDPDHVQAKRLMDTITELQNANSGDVTRFKLSLNVNEKVTLEFKDTQVINIFSIISELADVNFIFDKDIKKDEKASIFVENVYIEDALNLILMSNALAMKILNQNTIMIYPDTVQKAKEYQDLYLRNFYIVNADVNEVAKLIQTMLETSYIHVDEKLNLIVIRDTLQVIRLAEKLIDAKDVPEPEVMLELEVLEINSNRFRDIGIRYPEQIGVSITGNQGGTAGNLTINEWRSVGSDDIAIGIADPALLLKIKETETDTNLLANPRIRIVNKKSAKIHIGERLPVITTTTTANVGTSESITYLDVGLKLDLEPRIHMDNDVTIKLSLEVSNILEIQTLASGATAYRLGTRNADTELRLRSGETGILAGLIQNEERKAQNKLPWLSDFPILGKLFTSKQDNTTKTELVLLVTPTVIRNIIQPGKNEKQFYSGTENKIEANLTLITPSEDDEK